MELLAMAVAATVLLYLLGGRSKKRSGDTIQGWAKVTDGDGIKVKGYTVRLAGLDAPEWNQPAKHRFGFWFNHGKRVKRALSRELAGRRVQVRVEGYDRYGRVLGVSMSNENCALWGEIRRGFGGLSPFDATGVEVAVGGSGATGAGHLKPCRRRHVPVLVGGVVPAARAGVVC